MERKLDPDQKSTKDSEYDKEIFEEASDRDISVLQIAVEFEKMCKRLPLTLNFITGKRSSRWCVESYLWNDIHLPSLLCFLDANTNLGGYSINPAEYTDSVYRNLSFLKLSLNFTLSGPIVEDLIYHRNRRIRNDTGAIFPQRSLRGVIGNLVTSHSESWMLDSFQGNAKKTACLKRLFFVHLCIVDGAVNQPRFKSLRPVLRTLEYSSIPLLGDDTSLQKFEMALLGNESSEVKFSEVKSIFCPSVNSTFSCQSTLSVDATVTKAQLQCLQKGGRPCFIFSVDDAPQVIYLASPQKVESSAENAIDCIYSFYFKDTKNITSRSHSPIPTILTAKMKVSSSIVLKPNFVKVMETEFVLYGSHEKLSNEPQNSFSFVSRSKSFPKKITETLRPSNLRKNKSKDKVNGHKLNGLDHSDVISLQNDSITNLLPNLELASMVVEECLQDTTNDLTFNGWGLKFLEKTSRKDTSSEPLFSQCCSGNPDGSARSMHVLVPAGPHGGRITRNGGITSLIDRWKSGGHCDCGGWDLGCPLRVLNYSSIYSNVSPEDTEKKPLNLFMEGTRNEHPTLCMMKMTEDFYSICFRSPLSALQSFSIAIATIHAKIVDKKIAYSMQDVSTL